MGWNKGNKNPMFGIRRHSRDNPFFGRKHSDETRRKMSEAHKGKNKGRKPSKETLIKRGKAMKKVWQDPKYKKRVSKAVSETKKRLYKEGKLKVWSEGMEFDYKPNYKLRGKRPWNKGLTKETDERVKKIGLAHKGRKLSEEIKEKLRKIMTGKNNPRYGMKCTKETLIKKSKSMKKIWQNSKYREKTIKAILKGLQFKPNKPEKKLIKIIQENNLPFNYVGDGRIWFRGENHSFNPDFLSKNPKYIIELFGDYFHNLPKARERDKERLATYAKYGYKTLVIWEHELKNPAQVVNKISGFRNN